MSDLISRQEAIDELESYGEFIAINIIKELPTAQPEPSQIARDIATIIENEQDMRVILAQPQRMRGRWNWHEDEDICNCSKCDFEINAEGCVDPYEYVKIYNFCPNCGADMREGNT